MANRQENQAGPFPDLKELQSYSKLETSQLTALASDIRDQGFGDIVTYSRKVFVPLTELCRDVCHYCTFAKTPKKIGAPFLTVEQVLEVVRNGQKSGCNEVLFTLGEKPELRFEAARKWLSSQGFESTIEYLTAIAGQVLRETGMIPHINAGTLSAEELKELRKVSASMGIMLETASHRLSDKGMPHHGSPDKNPEVRLESIRRAGVLKIPMTTGLLIGIGETLQERLESIIAIRDLHQEYGHIQEVIIQNFCPKPGTRMAKATPPTQDEFLRAIALARIAFGTEMSIQAPPNLSPTAMPDLIAAGINDWGGVSPVTIDHVNPEAPWPHLDVLERQSKFADKQLTQRLTIYPQFIEDGEVWLDPAVRRHVLRRCDSSFLARECDWAVGGTNPPPQSTAYDFNLSDASEPASKLVASILEQGRLGEGLTEDQIVRLFQARGSDVGHICRAADELRQKANGDTVSYVVVRNINYTNVCTYGCKFCAFSKGKTHENLRGKPYDLTLEEIVRRSVEAWDRGASEVCLQGGIHPEYTGQTYIDICKAIKSAKPDMHLHGFSPLEVTQGAETLGTGLEEFLVRLKEAGLGSLPGTAAEILDDEVRDKLCPDKIDTAQWTRVIETAHKVGLKTTSTIMFGHVEHVRHWARHLLRIREIQERTGGITELVPLPFVAKEAPMFLRGQSRPGPTYREAVLMHAVARIVLHPVIPNIQASWVKLGPEGVQQCLSAGVNDLGGTLMNESITRAAGAQHGQEAAPQTIENWIQAAGRQTRQRNTLYGDARSSQKAASYVAKELTPVVNNPLRKRKRNPSSDKQAAVVR